jgi:hypothetical protein
MIPKNFILVAAALLALGALGAVAAAGDHRGHEAVSQATARFGDVALAQASGYGLLGEAGRDCVRYVNAGLASDPSVDVQTPEALLYERLRDGRLRLVGVEYIVLQSAWDAGHKAPPSLFNRRFALLGAGNGIGPASFYELTAGIPKDNPGGMFTDWNPRATCASSTPTKPEPIM